MDRFNWYYCFAILIISCGGIPKGYDEGGYSASVDLPSFQADFDLLKSAWKNNPDGLANRVANITSFGVLGAAFGALAALYCNDRFGRLMVFRVAAAWWLVGALMQVFSSGIYGLLLCARIWSGVGAGALTGVSPMFLSEIAGRKVRGMVVCCYMSMLLLAFTVGYFVNYGAEVGLPATSREQYRLVQAVPMIPTGFALISSIWLVESPRWLASKGRLDEAAVVLSKLRNEAVDHPTVVHEVAYIESQVNTIAADLEGDGGLWSIVKDTFTISTFRKRLLLVWMVQCVAQWSGGQGISFYAPTIFAYAGASSASASLLLSGGYGITKLVVTVLFAVLLVDRLGRRPCLLAGIFLQLCAHVYLSCYLGIRPTDNADASNAAIAALYIYAVGWSVGLCTIEFIYASEIFPTRIRSFAYGSTVSIHWFFQFAVVRVLPDMFISLHVWGVFVFFAAICAIGLVVLGVWAPETKQVPLERMDELFSGKWYTGWRAKLSHSQGDDDDELPGKYAADAQFEDDVEEKEKI